MATVIGAGKAVFLSYASQDAEAANHICEALRAAGVEVWFDQSELRGGDAWDALIRRQIKACYLFVPLISANTQSREEGYFRREWNLAVARTLDMAEDRTFLLPTVIDETPDSLARVPEKFRDIQWMRLPAGAPAEDFVAHVQRLLVPASTPAHAPAAAAAEPIRAVPTAHRSYAPWIVVGFLVLAAVFLLVNRFLTSDRAAPAAAEPVVAAVPAGITEKSVAVLPFVDMSEKKDQEYFSDGLSEELIDLLARTQGLQVIARTSSFYFKGKQVTIAEIARTLNVANVLEGSVRKAGNTIRVTAQLVRARDGVGLWSATYDRSVDDVFKVQDEISSAVVAALKIQLLQGAVTTDSSRTANAAAHNQYLLARQYAKRSSPDGYRRAVEFFRKAVELDPGYAAAFAGLAEAEYWLAEFTDFGAGFQRALSAADEAIALAPGLADGYAARALVRNDRLFDFAGAEADIEKAVAANPGDSHIQTRYAEVLATVNRTADAEVALRKAIELDPLSIEAWQNMAALQMTRGQFAAARASIERAFEVDPGSGFTQGSLAQLELMQGHLAEALAAAQKIDIEAERLMFLAMVNHALGRGTDSDNALRELVAKHAHDSAYQVADAYAWRGERRSAFEWLERSYQQRDGGLVFIETDPFLNSLRGDEAFRAFLRRMKLPG